MRHQKFDLYSKESAKIHYDDRRTTNESFLGEEFELHFDSMNNLIHFVLGLEESRRQLDCLAKKKNKRKVIKMIIVKCNQPHMQDHHLARNTYSLHQKSVHQGNDDD